MCMLAVMWDGRVVGITLRRVVNQQSKGPTMNCPNCGATLPPDTGRCRKCGSYVEQAPQLVAAPPPAAPPLAAPAQLTPMVAQPIGPPVKSKITAGLLGIFLGCLGIHRFYLGYTGIGLAQILMTLVGAWFTCGLSAVAAGIWGLIDGILILTGALDRDADGRSLIT